MASSSIEYIYCNPNQPSTWNLEYLTWWFLKEKCMLYLSDNTYHCLICGYNHPPTYYENNYTDLHHYIYLTNFITSYNNNDGHAIMFFFKHMFQPKELLSINNQTIVQRLNDFSMIYNCIICNGQYITNTNNDISKMLYNLKWNIPQTLLFNYNLNNFTNKYKPHITEILQRIIPPPPTYAPPLLPSLLPIQPRAQTQTRARSRPRTRQLHFQPVSPIPLREMIIYETTETDTDTDSDICII